MIKIETKQLQEGAILAQPVITPLGQPLAPAGSAVNPSADQPHETVPCGICRN